MVSLAEKRSLRYDERRESKGKWKMQRQCFLDRLRVAATCAVVLLHTITGVMDSADMTPYPLEEKVFLAALDLITWCVPLFVLISGYLFLNPDKELPFKRMLAKYCRRILFALFLFGVPYTCIELIILGRPVRINMIAEAFLMVCRGQTWSHMWYLYLVLFLYLITPLLQWFLKQIPKSCLYATMAFLLLGSSILPFLKKLFALDFLVALPDGGIYLFYYLCGYLFVCADKEEGDSVTSQGNGLVKQGNERLKVAVVVLICLFGGMVCSRLFGDYRVQMAYNYPFTVAVSLLLMWLARKQEEKLRRKTTDFWRKAGSLCFAVYLIHPVFVNIFYKFLHITLLDFPIWISLPGFFLTVLALSVVTAWLLYRIPVLRKYVL